MTELPRVPAFGNFQRTSRTTGCRSREARLGFMALISDTALTAGSGESKAAMVLFLLHLAGACDAGSASQFDEQSRLLPET
jgi:hypothetical protein